MNNVGPPGVGGDELTKRRAKRKAADAPGKLTNEEIATLFQETKDAFANTARFDRDAVLGFAKIHKGELWKTNPAQYGATWHECHTTFFGIESTMAHYIVRQAELIVKATEKLKANVHIIEGHARQLVKGNDDALFLEALEEAEKRIRRKRKLQPRTH